MRWRPRRVIAAALVGVLAGAAAQCSAAAAAQDGRALLGLINDYRASAQRCGGQEVAAAGPLAPDTTLADAPLVAGSALHEALRAAGYAASRSAAITLTGPRDAAAAMQLLAQHYCAALSSARYAEIGIARDGEHWRIVLAQPLLASDLGSPREAGQRVLELVNAARAQARQCGDQAFAAVPALAWNARLMATALAHSSDMARRDDFAHVNRRGDRVGARLRRHGYDWRSVGENIAAGQGSARQVMAGWLASPGHCANIMNGSFTEMAAAYAIDRSSTATIYWTQVFARRSPPARR